MNKIVIIIFALLLLPYVGLPSAYDIWIVLALVAALLFFLFKIVQERRAGNTIQKDTPKQAVEKTKTQTNQEQETVLSKDDKDSIKEAIDKAQQ